MAETNEHLKAFVDRYERLEEEKKDIAEQQKELLAELKGEGYEVPAFKRVIKYRAADKDKLAEEEAVFEMYRDAVGG